MSGRNLNKTDLTELQKQTKNEPLWTGHITQTQHNFLSMQSMHTLYWVEGYVNFVLRDKNLKLFVSFSGKTSVMFMLYAFINIDIYKHVPAYHKSIIFPFSRKIKQI